MRFTSNQEKVIKSSGNVIVSAGAGSGKTTVLTERVRQNILGLTGNKVNLDELLILTFTNDAATSMKNKIKESLSKDETLAFLVPFVDSAHIETFDAYSQFIVKKYGYLEGYSNNINVLDDDILYVKAANTITDKLNEQYSKKDTIFADLIFDFCPRNDNKLNEFLLNVYNEILRKKDDPIIFLKEYKSKILNKGFFDDFLENINVLIREKTSEAFDLIQELNTSELLEFYQKNFASFTKINSLKDLLEHKEEIKDYESLSSEKNNIFKTSQDPYILIEKFVSNRLFKIYKDLSKLTSFDLDTFLNIDIDKQVKYLNYLIDNVLLPSIEEIERFKKDTNYFTFSDIAKIAINILKNHEDIRLELKNKYKLIMIDETQDTSSSQEEFINLIANNNVFSVGDIKQSIYKFRNAKPEYFKKKYDLYSKNEGGIALNMNENFRSRKEILNVVNDMFSTLMSDEFGGANYPKDHIIKAGNKDYDTFGYDKTIEHGVFQLPFSAIYFDGDELLDNSEAKCRGEASAICDNIKSRIENGFKVYDAKSKTLRPASYKDFTILTYKKTHFKIFEEVFKEKGIPLNAIYSDDLREDNSIVFIINIFSLIELLSKDDLDSSEISKVRHLLASILRSFIFKYSDDELYNLFKNNSDAYLNNEIYLKIKDIAKKYANGSISKLYEVVLKEFDYLKAFISLDDAINTIDKNNIFFNKTRTMDELGYSISDFVLYLKSLNDFDIKMEQVIYSEASDAVTITSIHKSKGLEYPVVYLPNLYDFTQPKFTNNGDYYVVGEKYFFLPFFADPKKRANIINFVLSNDKKYIQEDRAERLRLLYVALTRAKEDLIFVLSDEKVKNHDEVFKEYLERVKSRLDKKKIIFTEEDARRIAINELNSRVKEQNGATFNDFLFNAFIDYPLDPYMDKSIMEIDDAIEKVAKEENKELKEKIKIRVLHYYFNNNHSLKNIDVAKIMDEVKNFVDITSRDKKQDKREVLFKDGAFKVFDQYLIEIVAIIVSKDLTNLELNFYAYKKFYLNNLTKAEVEQILQSIRDNNSEVLESYLVKYFDENFERNKEFEKIPSRNYKLIKEINIEKQVKPRFEKASKDKDDDSDETSLNYGSHIHSLLETISLTNPDFTFIKDQRESQLISGAIKLLNTFNLEDYKIFKEYQFEDDKHSTKGIIDLLLVGKDEAIIIDYKLKNIDDEAYNKQLKVYKDFVTNSFNLKTKTYLLSIIDQTIKEIDG